MSTPYNEDFYEWLREESLNSARALTPLLLGLFKPGSVVDVGCGTGAWLSEFVRQGVTDVLGLDGDYVDRRRLLIPGEVFEVCDLARPRLCSRRYDLALSLEVAEHLPATAADVYIKTLTQVSERIVFSAAVPHQGGTEHVNEQWPSYWVDRFAVHGYELIPEFRWLAWSLSGLTDYYAQNINLFAARSVLEELRTAVGVRRPVAPLDIVHPRCWQRLHALRAITMREHLADLPRAFREAVEWRWRKWGGAK